VTTWRSDWEKPSITSPWYGRLGRDEQHIL